MSDTRADMPVTPSTVAADHAAGMTNAQHHLKPHELTIRPAEIAVSPNPAITTHAVPAADPASRAVRQAEIDKIMGVPRRWMRIFYAAVLTFALIGQTGSAQHWLHWHIGFAAALVAVWELGGVAILAYADGRRQLGERALAARFLSSAVAIGAVTINWQGHLTHAGRPTIQAGVFAGLSALGYLVWVMESEARRRDRRRIAGDMAAIPPSYGFGLWLCHPVITSRARSLAKAHPGLGTYDSWNLAQATMRRERMTAEMSRALRGVLADNTDGPMTEIACLTYDLDDIARRVADRADYDRIAEILSDRLSPEKVTGERRRGPVRSNNRSTGPALDQTGPDTEAVQTGPDTEAVQTAVPDRTGPKTKRSTTADQTGLVRRLHAVQTDRLSQEDRVEVLDRTWPDRIPSYNEAMTELSWTSRGETGKAIKALRLRREQPQHLRGEAL